MKKGHIPHIGKETWKILEKIRDRGNSDYFIEFLDLILNSLLSMTENYQEVAATKDLNKLSQGKYNERYLEIVNKYKNQDKDRKVGNRTIDLFAHAWGTLHRETLETKKDVIGEIFQAQVTYGEHGQFFTPEHITDVMASLVGKSPEVTKSNSKLPETMSDPCCGSGRFILSMAKKNSNCYFIGQDIDNRCCKMAIINMWIFDLTGEIRQGNSLAYKIEKRWIVKKGGFLYEDNQERDIRPENKIEKPLEKEIKRVKIEVQQTL